MAILDVHFHKVHDSALEFEIIPLESLWVRQLDHALHQPQRPQFFVVMVVTDGQGTHHIDFKPYTYDSTCLLLVAKGQVQRFEINVQARGFLLVFTSRFLYQNATSGDIKHGLHVFDHIRHSPRLPLEPDQRLWLRRWMEQLWLEYQHPPDPLRPEMLRTQLRLLLLWLERLRKAQQSNDLTTDYRLYVRFRELLEGELDQSHSVQYFAERLNLSPKKLNLLTKRLLGKTAKSFIDEMLVLEIQRHLAEAHSTVKQVAFALGFDEVTNMVKFFKKRTGQTPSSFRGDLGSSQMNPVRDRFDLEGIERNGDDGWAGATPAHPV